MEVSDENRVNKKEAQARRNQRRLWWVSALSWSTLALAITGFITAWNQVSQGTPQTVVSAFTSSGSGSASASGSTGSGLFEGATGSDGTSGFGSAGPSQSSSGLFGSGAS